MPALVVTDVNTFAIVFVVVLAILAVLGIAYLIFGSMDENQKKDAHLKLENLKLALDRLKPNIVADIAAHPSEYAQMDVEKFIEKNRSFLEACISYGQHKGLDRYSAIEDTVIYSHDIIVAYSEVSVLPEHIEEHTELVSSMAQDILRLEALEAEQRNVLKGGLAYPS